MEQATRYATTSDGVRIAFSVMGQGAPFIEMPPIPFSYSAGHSTIPEWDAWTTAMARRGTYVRYDCRGAGLSDRNVTDYSLAAWLRDLETVVDGIAVNPVTLFAATTLAVPVAIAFAARRPERVSHLILWQAHAQPGHLINHPGFVGILDLMDKDWELFSETLAHMTEGWSEPTAARQEAALIRENHTARGLRAAWDAAREFDVSELMPSVTAPTLVLHRREGRHPISQSRQVASQIPNARLVVVEGSSTSWSLQHPEAVLQAIDEFLVGEATSKPLSAELNSLSPREGEILRLLAEGRSSREIAEELVLAVRTVERHITNVYRKIDAHNRAQATAFALKHGLTDRG